MGRKSGDSDCIEIGKGSEWSRTVMVRSGPQWLTPTLSSDSSIPGHSPVHLSFSLL